VEYDMCPGCGHVYRGATAQPQENQCCPNDSCQRPRLQDEAKKKPWLTLVYRPIRFYLERVLATPALARLMGYHASPEGTLGGEKVLADINDGEAYKKVRQRAPFNADPRHALLMLFHDGFLPFRGDDKYSCWVFMLTLANLPLWIRTKLGVATILTIVPGTRDADAKLSLKSVKEILADELVYLQRHGWRVKDSSTNQPFRCHAQLVHETADSRQGHVRGTKHACIVLHCYVHCTHSWGSDYAATRLHMRRPQDNSIRVSRGALQCSCQPLNSTVPTWTC
jgi:Transposase family tnp2